MRSLCLSFLFLVLSLAVVVSAGWPSAAQDKTFAVSILVEHNNVRQKYNVQLLIWDDGLAKMAQDWADKIAASGALPPAHRASGENLFWGTADQWPVKDVLAVWEAESKNYDRATNTCAPGKNCVHFTQVVWWTTTRVGCGIAKGTTKDGPTDFIVCDYSPPGNEVGKSPFPIPPTATTTPIVTPSPITPPVIPAPTPVKTPATPAATPATPPVTPAPTPVTTPVTPAATPVTTPLTPAPTPVTTPVTPAPIPAPAPTPNANTKCEDLPKNVERLSAEVEQLSKSLATPTPTPIPVARKIPPAPTPTPEFTIIEATPTPTVPEPCYRLVLGGKTRLLHYGSNQYGIEFMQIPAGRFIVSRFIGEEKPQTVHEGTIRSFCMGKYEVTQAQWQAVMGSNPSRVKDCVNCPVDHVTWNDAQNFINKLNELNDGWRYRLPSEAEWEYAGRAGTTGDYPAMVGAARSKFEAYVRRRYGVPWEDREGSVLNEGKLDFVMDEIAWWFANSKDKTHAVGGKQPNAWGLYDMFGNVQEWCEDAWPWLGGGEGQRVLRGGHWGDYPGYHLRYRQRLDQGDSDHTIGFRVVAVPLPTPTPRPASCEELRQSEQQLTARVEQLRKQVEAKYAKLRVSCALNGVSGNTQLITPNKYGIKFLKIPAGRFMMGGEGKEDRKPVHEVTIRSFCLGEYEVTQAQWQAVMGSNPSLFKDCGGNCPVEQVSWDDALNFINKLNESKAGWKYRLPTEAEWEYAFRAGTTGDIAGNLSEMAWNNDNSGEKTHAVGGKQPNAWGLYDMHGNVFEWCEDWYHENYVGAPTDGSAWLSDGEQTHRVLRGGSWADYAISSRSAYRNWGSPVHRRHDYGFRVVAVPR